MAAAQAAGTRRLRPLSLDGVNTYPLALRASKVSRSQLARPHRRGGSLASFLSSLPRILAGDTLRELGTRSCGPATSADRSCGAWARTS